jgi:hypothetical protein
MYERELKCGNCQLNRRVKRARAESGLSISDKSSGRLPLSETKVGQKRLIEVEVGRICPPHAVQPMRGGMAPTTDPTQVLAILLRFIQV